MLVRMSDEVPQQVLLRDGTVGLEDPVQEMVRVEQVLPLRLPPPGHAAIVRRPVGPAVVPVVHREAVLQQILVQVIGLEGLEILVPPPPTWEDVVISYNLDSSVHGRRIVNNPRAQFHKKW